MSPEERELLNKSVALAEENNSMLRSMRRGQRWANIVRAVYWIVIIGTAVGAFYFLQPYFDEVMRMYTTVSREFKNLNK